MRKQKAKTETEIILGDGGGTLGNMVNTFKKGDTNSQRTNVTF